MKKQRAINLLTKTSVIYLVFTFVALFFCTVYITHEADKFINHELTRRFAKEEKKVVAYINSGTFEKNHRLHSDVFPLDTPPELRNYPTFSDSSIFDAESEQMHLHRIKTIIVQAEGRYYKAVMRKSIEDFARFRDDIIGSVLPAFILLTIAIVLFNYLLSGYLFRPFNRILNQMKGYQAGQGMAIEQESTSTREFSRMQQLFHRMIERIEHDYKNLKEYTENMAHELQTPLAVIRNKTENLIADDATMQAHPETVKIIYDETNHLSKLGNTLNLLTKIENGEFNKAVSIETLPVIEKHISAIEELVKLKSFTVETNLSTEHRLLIDPFLLDIVLKNLLRNAIGYGNPEAGPIEISTTAESFSISNFGPPMDIPTENLFQRFNRTTNNHSSLGLGLSLVERICRLNDLKIVYRYKGGRHIFTIE